MTAKQNAVLPCAHPPTRLFTWFAHDGTLCIACCDCGAVLAGVAQPWRQITEAEENQETIAPEDIVFEAKTVDGYILGSTYIEGFGPLAYANNPDRLGFDTYAFCGRDALDAVTNGKPHAVRLLQKLIAYERRTTP